MQETEANPKGQSLEERKLALMEAVLLLEQEEDLAVLETSVIALQESIRARQLVIGYLPNGNVVLKQRFLDRLRHTLQDIKHDEFVTLPELEQRAADW